MKVICTFQIREHKKGNSATCSWGWSKGRGSRLVKRLVARKVIRPFLTV